MLYRLFFFQAEDGIRDLYVTGVQTCALPISGPAGEKKYVHGAFTERYSAFWLGARSLDSMAGAGILPGFAGIVVSGRYQNYFHPRWEHIAGNQACLSHLVRDFEDCAESYPG